MNGYDGMSQRDGFPQVGSDANAGVMPHAADADRVAASLPNAQALHGDIAQSSREVTLDSFRKGKINVLVATDVAARGLDIPEVRL